MTDGGGARLPPGLAEDAMEDAASANPIESPAYDDADGGTDGGAEGGADGGAEGPDDDDIESIPDLQGGGADSTS